MRDASDDDDNSRITFARIPRDLNGKCIEVGRVWRCGCVRLEEFFFLFLSFPRFVLLYFFNRIHNSYTMARIDVDGSSTSCSSVKARTN